MRAALSILGLTALSSLGAAEGLTRCGTETTESFRNLAASIAEEESKGSFRKPQESIEIPTYFHVVTSGASSMDVTVRSLGVFHPQDLN